MTLVSRNTIMKVFLGLFLVLFLTFLIFMGISLTKNFLIAKDFSFLNTSTIATYGSFLFYMVYSCITLILMYRSFEKTQAPEIVYFCIFLLGFFLQGFRLLIPILAIQNSFSSMFVLLGKISFVGKFLSCTSFVMAALFSDEDEIQNMDRNFIMLILLALVFGSITPINTLSSEGELFPHYGFEQILDIFQVVIFTVTAISFIVIGRTKFSYPFKEICLGYICIFLGITLLPKPTIISSVISILLVMLGTYLYLSRLHKFYLWK